MPTTNLFTVVAADVKAAVDAITGGLKWFENEAKLAIAWIDKNVPGAQTALATLFQAADAAATTLEAHASTGLADVVSGAVDEAGTTVANLISASGLDLTSKAELSAADVATVTAAQSIAHNAISVATAKLLGQAASAAQAAPKPAAAAPVACCGNSPSSPPRPPRSAASPRAGRCTTGVTGPPRSSPHGRR
jgi:hypothetical protein